VAKPARYTTWSAFVLFALAGVIGSATLAAMRIFDLIPAEKYPWPRIVAIPIVILVFPGMLWLVQQTWTERWFERFGIIMLFGAVPGTIVWLVIKLFIGQ
jgi:hypothetical protein